MPTPEKASGVKGVETLGEIYKDTRYVTLYRYENPEKPYKKEREGVVSKSELVGKWFTDNLKDLKAYTKARTPGGRLVAVRVLASELSSHDATQMETTKNMDIELGNYIVPDEAQTTRLEIPLEVAASAPRKFLFKDFALINAHIDEHLSDHSLVVRAEAVSGT